MQPVYILCTALLVLCTAAPSAAATDQAHSKLTTKQCSGGNCWPLYYILGAPKAGSSSLWELFNEHYQRTRSSGYRMRSEHRQLQGVLRDRRRERPFADPDRKNLFRKKEREPKTKPKDDITEDALTPKKIMKGASWAARKEAKTRPKPAATGGNATMVGQASVLIKKSDPFAKPVDPDIENMYKKPVTEPNPTETNEDLVSPAKKILKGAGKSARVEAKAKPRASRSPRIKLESNGELYSNSNNETQQNSFAKPVITSGRVPNRPEKTSGKGLEPTPERAPNQVQALPVGLKDTTSATRKYEICTHHKEERFWADGNAFHAVEIKSMIDITGYKQK